MNNLILRGMSGMLAVGLALWSPGVPFARAQVEVTPEVREACSEFEPELREVALSEVLPAIESEPDGQEARLVEVAAQAIHEAGATSAELPIPDANELVNKLTRGGVDPATATQLAADTQRALSEVKAAFAAGDPGKAEKLAHSFQEECVARGVDPSVFGTGRETGGITFDRVLASRDVVEEAMKAHFEAAYQEAVLRGGPEGMVGPPREVMEQMMAAGINPAEVFHGGAGEVPTMDPKMLENMTPEQRAGYETWKSGDFAALHDIQMNDAMKAMADAGMSPEAMATEMDKMATMHDIESQWKDADPATREALEQMGREMMDKASVENNNFDNKQENNFNNYTPPPGPETLVAIHDHDLNGFPDEYHYDTNGDNVADHAHSTPH